MEREILFRGKNLDSTDWIYGMPTYDFKFIFNEDNTDSSDNYKVLPKTVGQFTGVIDKKGVKIFEGDLIEIPYNNWMMEGVHEVFFYEGSWVTSSVIFANKESANKHSLIWIVENGGFVIGNIHEKK